MSASIWDRYADWSLAATADSFPELKRKITGTPTWGPNHASDTLKIFFETMVSVHREYNVSVCALDFGCGLGRNAPLLKSFFPRVIGVDLPEMITRFRAASSTDMVYDAVYESIDVLMGREDPNVIYDSVVFQHIVSVPYMNELVSKLLRSSSFRTLVSLKIHGMYDTVMQSLLKQDGWRVVFSEDDVLSFQGAKHATIVMRRGV